MFRTPKLHIPKDDKTICKMRKISHSIEIKVFIGSKIYLKINLL